MNLTNRRILYILFFLIFCIAVPLILLYSLGYSYNPKKKAFEDQGGLFIKFTPANALLSINGAKTDSSSPADITNLLPGDYSVSLSKEGYHSWTRKVQILPLQTQTFSDVNLFPNLKPTTTAILPRINPPLRKHVSNFSLAPKQNSLVAESLLTNATTTLQLTALDRLFETPGIHALIQFEPARGIFSITPHSEKRLTPHRFQGVKDFQVRDSTLLFWNDYELWMYSNVTQEPELITRNSRGIATATFYQDHYLIYGNLDGDVIVIDVAGQFGRVSSTLASLEGIERLVVDENTLFIETTKDASWWQIPLK